MVKRLRRRPLTAKTGVRVPVGLPILTQLFKLGFLQRCLSGLRSTIGNRVYFIRVPRVQIPLSAPCTRCLISDGFLLATALRSVCVQKPCRAATGATLRERYCRNNVTRSAFHAAIAVPSRHPPLLTNPVLCAKKNLNRIRFRFFFQKIVYSLSFLIVGSIHMLKIFDFNFCIFLISLDALYISVSK